MTSPAEGSFPKLQEYIKVNQSGRIENSCHKTRIADVNRLKEGVERMHGPSDDVATSHRDDSVSDGELMLLYQKDNEDAFAKLYRRYAARVYGYLCKNLRDPQAAADVCQLVFLKLHRARATYDAAQPFAPWLFTITHHARVDWQRSQNKHTRQLLYGMETAWDRLIDPEPTAERSIDSALISSLPKAQRQAIELRYMDNQSFEAIARQLETSEANARQLVSRGLKKIRALFPRKEKNL